MCAESKFGHRSIAMITRIAHVLRAQEVPEAVPIWVAVSGGADSMVLLHVLRTFGHPCHVAHVDHGLRGSESDADRVFVEDYCAQHDIPCTIRRIDLKGRTGPGRSMQMVAREARYEWFNELVATGPARMALAHHLDDAVETLLMSLMRGIGGSGLALIPGTNGPFHRPLIHERKDAILEFAVRHGVPYREDASNTDPTYLRNRVRHELLPLMEALRPGSGKVLGRNVEVMKEFGNAMERMLPVVLEGIHPDADGTSRLPFTTLLKSGMPRAVLGYWLRDATVHPDRIEDMLQAIRERNTGAFFPLEDRTVFVDRDHLVLRKARSAPHEWYFNSLEEIAMQQALHVEYCQRSADRSAQGRDVAWLDPEAMPFPWILRPWRPGDRMRPLGTGGSKLVSDILIDAKVPRDRKDRVHVLEVDGTIAWCCGLRVGQAFAAHPSQRKVYRCTWKEPVHPLGGGPL